METIGHKIYNARRKKGFSQERLADEAGISLRTLQRMEKSETQPHGHTLKAICSVLDLQVEDLMDYGKQENTRDLAWIHLSVLGELVIPLGGLIIPFILWMNRKQNVILMDAHGKNILNFQILYVIFSNAILFMGVRGKLMHWYDLSYFFITYVTLLVITKIYAIWAASTVGKNPSKLFYPNWIRFVK